MHQEAKVTTTSSLMLTTSSLKEKIRSQKSWAWYFITPLFLFSTLFWMAALALAPILFLVLEGVPSIIAPIIWACIIALPVAAAFGPIVAPKQYLQHQFGVVIVTDDPKYRNLVSEVNDMAHRAGLKDIKYVGIVRGELNAFAFGLSSRQSAVVLGTDLLEQLDPDQIRAIIGHEVGHLISGDTKLSTMLMVCNITYRNGIILPISKVARFFGLNFLSAGWLMPVYDRGTANESAVLRLIGILFLAFSSAVWIFGVVTLFIINLIERYHSRRREHRADVVGGLLTSRKHMMSALAALESAVVGELPADPFSSLKVINHAQKTASSFFGLLDSHPATRDRILFLNNSKQFDD